LHNILSTSNKMAPADIKHRRIYAERISPHIRKNIIKVITGHRRSGKSYLLLGIMEMIRTSDPDSNIIYLNKEFYEFDEIKDYHGLQAYFDEKFVPGLNNYFFIDEIQEILNFEKCIRNVLAKNLADIYISGSNADILSGELATLLSGRYIEINVHPLSYPEYLDFYQLPDATGSFYRYLQYGGMPGLINTDQTDTPVTDYLKGILSTVLLKDVVARYKIRNVYFLENLAHYLAANTGTIVSAKNISDFLKSQKMAVSPNITLDYLGYLCKAYIANRVLRMDVTVRKIFEVGEKYYFEDLGLRNTLSGYKPADISMILENVVYNHLIIAGYEVFVGRLGAKEVDFVAGKGGETLYVQVCYLLADEKVYEREFGNLLAIPDNYKKVVVSMDEFPAPNTYKGIEHKYIPGFCKELVSSSNSSFKS